VIILPDWHPQLRKQSGVLVASSKDAIAVLLDVPVVDDDGTTYTHVVAKLRHQETRVDNLIAGEESLCACTWIPAAKFDSLRPCDTSWWRGGMAAIASIHTEDI
jgi:hypothetical protein